MTQRLRGRKPELDARPVTGQDILLWVLRINREYSRDMAIQHTPSFAALLSGTLKRKITTATVNRMETGAAPLTQERLHGYETLFAKEPLDLVDLQIYLSRLSDDDRNNPGVVTSLDPRVALEAGFRIRSPEQIGAADWLEIGTYVGRLTTPQSDLSLSMRDAIAERFFADFASAFEKRERLLREALIRMGPVLDPYLAESVLDHPLELFNVLESLGFLNTAASLDTLRRVIAAVDDDAVGQTVIEPARRRLVRDRSAFSEKDLAALADYCSRLLVDPKHAYASRQEALCFLLDLPPNQRPRTFERYLHDRRDEARQLLLEPTYAPQDYMDHVMHRIGHELVSSGVTGRNGATAVPAGLRQMVYGALFSRNRIDRLKFGIALSHTPLASPIAVAAAASVAAVPSQDPGVACSLLRLVTKLAQPAGFGSLSNLVIDKSWDDSVRLTLAWGLGMGTEASDEAMLRQLQSESSDTTQRVVLLAAARRGMLGILMDSATDGNSMSVRSEATRLLRGQAPGSAVRTSPGLSSTDPQARD